MRILAMLAEHNAWANRRVFEAVGALDERRLNDEMDGYDSVVGILQHLVQVEHAFFELAHGRPNSRVTAATVGSLRDECERIDRAYIDYGRALDPDTAEAERFVVPWFGFEITRAEGILQPLTHAHKHRADVSMLLPRLGGAGVEMDLIQWLAEGRGPAQG